MPASNPIVSCKIHPAIGIARVGNSTRADGFFIGPEAPGESRPPAGGYKDPADPSVVLKQACRFRIFGYDAQGKVVGVIPPNAAVTWQVQLGNKKAEWHKFNGPDGESAPPTMPKRNPTVTDRASLVITTTAETLSGPNGKKTLSGPLGVAGNRPVTLGEIRTDGDGNLILLGGSGASEAWTNPPTAIHTYANNDGWFDTTSDGPVTAKVVIGGAELPVAPAWAIVGPPDFAPTVNPIVTLYDIASQVAVDRRWAPDPSDAAFRPTFLGHILPILERAMGHQWVSGKALTGHGPDGPGDFTPDLAKLGDPNPQFNPNRQRIFRVVRNPNLAPTSPEAIREAAERYMPQLSGDEGDTSTGEFRHWLTVTRAQYAMLTHWSKGEFDPGSPPTSRALTPEGLDRAALEACVGGAFFPGIEAGWVMRRNAQYKEMCRIDHDVPDLFSEGTTRLEPGDLTKRSALPWQADFHDCRDAWWPARRPDDVLTLETYRTLEQLDAELAALDPNSPDFSQKSTDRDAAWNTRALWAWKPKDDGPRDHELMVHDWSRLGFVVGESPDGSPFVLKGKPQFVEVGRDPALPRE